MKRALKIRTVTMTVSELRNLQKVLKLIQRGEVIVTCRGRPQFRVSQMKEKTMEEVAEMEAFWDKIRRRIKGPSTPIEEVWKRLDVSDDRDKKKKKGAMHRQAAHRK